MQSQVERDEKTLAITTALALFVLVAGWAALWAARLAFGLDNVVMDTLFKVVLCLGVVSAIGYLVRDARRPGRSARRNQAMPPPGGS